MLGTPPQDKLHKHLHISNACEHSWIMMIMVSSKMYKTEYDLKVKVIGDDIRGQFFPCIWYIFMTTVVFWVNFTDNFRYTVSCSNKLNWKEMLFFSIKNVFIVLSLFRGMFVKSVGPIFWKKKLKLFAILSLLSILSPLIIKYDGKSFLLLHLLSNSFMVVQVCFIFDINLLNFESW